MIASSYPPRLLLEKNQGTGGDGYDYNAKGESIHHIFDKIGTVYKNKILISSARAPSIFHRPRDRTLLLLVSSCSPKHPG